MTIARGLDSLWRITLADPPVSTSDASAAVAVVAAAAGIVVTVYGVWERRRAFNAERDERDRVFAADQAELRRQADRYVQDLDEQRKHLEVAIKKEFLLEHYRGRLTPYGLVFRALGAVSKTGDHRLSIHGATLGQTPTAYQVLQQERGEDLASAAATLHEHLYGEAGLLMNQETRDRVSIARFACIDFMRCTGDLNDAGDRLVNAFYDARRYIRADIQLVDNRSAENIESVVAKLK